MLLNQIEDSVVNHIEIVAVRPFGAKRLVVVGGNLLVAVDFSKDDVGETGGEHVAPRL